MLCELCSGIEISLTERRTSAAASIFRKRDLKAKRFQYFHCGDPDVRLVIAHEGVIPQDDFASFL